MKLPAVAMASAFAGGIALGLHPAVLPHVTSGEANAYGHPSPELLERLEASGAHVLRMDRDGAVHVLTDGQQLEVSCFVACPGAAKVSSTLAKIPNQYQSRDEK